MMAKKGFDLAALAREQMGAGMAQSVETVREIAVADIDANDGNFYSMSDIEALAANIELLGLIHPVAVKPGEGGRWTLIDGERRFRAVQLLGRETIRAVVHRPVSSVFEELMLISANMQQRKLSSADLSKQAERYTECLADLKRSGVNIPGRLRSAVAEALDVSESKLARLAAIRSKLIPEALELFDAGTINESVAYALSRIPAEYQPVILEDADHLQSWRVDMVADNLDKFIHPNCMEVTTSCRAARIRAVLTAGYARCGDVCCLSCSYLTLCGGGCDRAKARAEEKRAEAKAAREAEAEARAAMEANAAAEHETKLTGRLRAADEAWARFKALREAAGVSTERAAEIMGLDAEDIEDAESRRCVGFVGRDETPLEQITAAELSRLADEFGVTADEIAGRETRSAWDWREGSMELPGPAVLGTICCWGSKGFRTVKAEDYATAREAFPGEFDWWCEPVPPRMSNLDREGGEGDEA